MGIAVVSTAENRKTIMMVDLICVGPGLRSGQDGSKTCLHTISFLGHEFFCPRQLWPVRRGALAYFQELGIVLAGFLALSDSLGGACSTVESTKAVGIKFQIGLVDRKSRRLNSSHQIISYAV